MTRPVLIIMRGLPGSGKTRIARNWAAADPTSRVRVSADALRTVMFGGHTSSATDDLVRLACHSLIGTMLRRSMSVVIDDHHLNGQVVRSLRYLAIKNGARHETEDLRAVPLEECIARDAAGSRPVGADVIHELHAQWIAATSHQLKTVRLDTDSLAAPTPPREAVAAAIAALRPRRRVDPIDTPSAERALSS